MGGGGAALRRGAVSNALQSALERLADADLVFVEGAPPQATYRFKHALVQDAAYESLLKSRRQALHRRAAEALLRPTRRARGDRPSFYASRTRRSRHRMVGQGGRPGLAPLGLPGGDRPSRQGDRDGGQGGRDGAAGDRRRGRPNQRLTQLHVAYGNALFARAATGRRKRREAFAQSPRVGVWRQGRARTVGGRLRFMGRQLHARRVAIDEGACGGLPQRRRGKTRFARGRRRPSRRRASLAGSPASIAKRGITSKGRSLVPAWPRRRSGIPLRTGCWRRRDGLSWRLRHGLSVRSIARFRSSTACRCGCADLTHVGTLASGRMHAALFELMRGDRARAAPNALELARLAHEQEPTMFRAFGMFLEGWATAASGAVGSGLEDMRRGVEQLRDQNVLTFDGLFKIALAEAEARAGDVDCAIAHPRRSARDV